MPLRETLDKQLYSLCVDGMSAVAVERFWSGFCTLWDVLGGVHEKDKIKDFVWCEVEDVPHSRARAAAIIFC